MNKTVGLERAISEALDAATDPGVRFLGLGVEAVSIERFRSNSRGWRGISSGKFFTSAEAAYLDSCRDRDADSAGYFAAKEAVVKALQLDWSGAFSWRWIEICPSECGSAEVTFAAELLLRRPDIEGANVVVFITRAREYAAAVALGIGRHRQASRQSRNQPVPGCAVLSREE